MHADKYVQSKKSICFDLISRLKFGEGSNEQFFLRGVG